MTTITGARFYNLTCKTCEILRKLFVKMFVGLVAMGENAGRARAAAELSRQGYHAEAKALMLQRQEEASNGL